tara:strand:+ start:42 stop:422 length:381 start_codon:yes stop_codon:yes gene_type:complete
MAIMNVIPLNRGPQPGDPVGTRYRNPNPLTEKVMTRDTRAPQIDGLGIMSTTTPPATGGPYPVGAPEGNQLFNKIAKTNVDKPMTYEMDSARKLNLKKVYDSNPTLQQKFKTFEKYLQQFMQPLKK